MLKVLSWFLIGLAATTITALVIAVLWLAVALFGWLIPKVLAAVVLVTIIGWGIKKLIFR